MLLRSNRYESSSSWTKDWQFKSRPSWTKGGKDRNMEMTATNLSKDVEVSYSGQVSFFNRTEGWTESFYTLPDEDQNSVVAQILKGNAFSSISVCGMDLDCEAHFLIYSQDVVDGKTSRMHHMELRDLPKEVRESIIWNVLLDPLEQKQLRYSDFFQGEELKKAMQKPKRRVLIEAIENGTLTRIDPFELQTLKTTNDFFFDRLCEEYSKGGKDATEDYANWLVSCSQLYGRTAHDLTDYAEQYMQYERSMEKEKEEEKSSDMEESCGEKKDNKKYRGR